MKKIFLAMILLNLLISVSYAGSNLSSSVTKEIRFEAILSDQILVSKSDGASWYDDIQYLYAEDIEGANWKSYPLDIRVRTRYSDKFLVELASNLELTSLEGGRMSNVDVIFGGKYLQKKDILQTHQSIDHYNPGDKDTTYKLQVKTEHALDSNGEHTDNGIYTGSAIIIFTPYL